MDKHTILLAEDHKIMREGLRCLLSNEPDLVVIGEADNGREAIRLANLKKPSLILLDISMPLTNGPDAIRAIKRRSPMTKILVLTVHESESHIRTAFKAGADGYILKGEPYTDLLIAIRQVLQGNKYLCPGICNNVLRLYLIGSLPTESMSPMALLTNREKEILKLIAEGMKNKEMAEHLSISVKTVEKHRSNLRRKLNLRGGPALTKYAIEHGLVNH